MERLGQAQEAESKQAGNWGGAVQKHPKSRTREVSGAGFWWLLLKARDGRDQPLLQPGSDFLAALV